MITRDELLYRPDIPKPERGVEYNPIIDPEDAALRDSANQAYKEELAAQLGIPAADVPMDPFTTMKARFQQLDTIALELERRSVFLLAKTVDDIDGYVGEAPPHILEYIEDLTGIIFTEEVCDPCTVCGGAKTLPATPDVLLEYQNRGVSSPSITNGTVACYACNGNGCINQRRLKQPTSPEYTLDNAVKQCIFNVAGYFDPTQNADILHAVSDTSTFNSELLKQMIDQKIKKNTNFKPLEFGMKLLVTVLKMAYVIAVHYTVGFLCGMLDKIKGVLNVIMGLGSILVDLALKPLEQMLLSLVGYRCNHKGEPEIPCTFPTGEKTDFKRVTCCTMEPIFFGGDEGTGQSNFTLSDCFRIWIREELNPDVANRTICGRGCNGSPMGVPTAEEMAKAAAVAEYLNNRPSRTGIMKPSDTYPLSRAIEASKSGSRLAQISASALDSARNYYYTGTSTGPWDCFGFDVPNMPKNATEAGAKLASIVNESSTGKSAIGAPLGTPIVEQGVYLFEYLKMVDDSIVKVLELADRAVIGTANLAKWGSSKELCCLVYIMVFVAAMVSSMIKKQRLCPDMNVADALANELSWASNLKLNSDVAKFAQVLQIIQMIVDMFNRKMNRSLMLAGLQLPMQEMWNQIKLVIGNGISQFLDILFSPIDTVLANFQAVPEIKAMLVNECFGIDKLFTFVGCLLGNLKFGITNWVLSFMDFAISDIIVINDIYLSRTRLAFLESLSKLLKSMISLLLGLQDCYEPKTVIDQIVDRQLQDQYTTMRVFTDEIAQTPQDVAMFDRASESLMNQSFIPPDSDIMAMDELQGSLSSTFGEISPVAESIMQRTMTANAGATDQSYRDREWWKASQTQGPSRYGVDFGTPTGYVPLAFSSFLNAQGDLISFGDFVQRMEAMTGTKVSEVRESMRYIFEILRGPDDTNV